MKYDAYVDPGSVWMGLIPKQWDTCLLKYMFTIEKRIAGEEGHTILSITQSGIKPKKMDEQGQFAQNYSKYQIVHPGDFAMNHMDLLTGWVDISKFEGVTSPDYRVFVNSDISKFCSEYYKFIFQYCYSNRVFYGMGQGVSGLGRWRLPADMFLNFRLPIPSFFEQKVIADYLNKKTANIDSIISETKASIEEYKKWKASIIYEAVTKGLDQNVPMKDSGVEWIGKIPSKWQFVKITRLLDWNHPYPIGDGDHGLVKNEDYTDSGIPYIRVQNLGWGTPLNMENVVYITEAMNEKIKNSTLQPNDILFAKTGATIGKTAIIPDNLPIANTTSHVGKITVNKEYNAHYIFYVLRSLVGFNQFWEIASAKTTRPELAIDEIKSLKIIMPNTYSEQQQIVDYLNAKIPSIDLLITEKESLITDLEAYKKSLIYEVVTGKRKVV